MTVRDDASSPRERALLAFSAIEEDLYDPRRTLYVARRTLWWNHYEALWPFAGAWSAACSLGALDAPSRERAHLDTFVQGLSAYHRGHTSAFRGEGPVGFTSGVVGRFTSGGDTFFDDNAWVTLALLQHYRVTADERCLALAGRIATFILSGWSTDERWAHPGGIRWKVPAASTTRNTCSNAPVAQAAAELFVHTGDEAWLSWSIRIYRWVRAALLGDDRLYTDRIDPDGTVVPTRWTYNQGTMIGTGTALARITGDAEYLEDAVATADAAFARFDVATMTQQAAAFNAVFARDLLLFDQVRPDPRYRALIGAYGDAMWAEARNPASGLFTGSTGSRLNDSAPMVQVYALLAGAVPTA